MPGTLFVVATPIGNLEDITLRALRILKEVDLIAAEDTRRTLKLLTHYGISKPMVSLREHNESREAAKLIGRLERGENVALVSDAGTPGIADPGARAVRAIRAAGLTVSPIPGPSAITAAISVAGLDSDSFTFAGFAPRSQVAKESWFRNLQEEGRPFVFLESPHRILATLLTCSEILVERQIMVMREITKMHENLLIWDNKMASDDDSVQTGELTVAVSGSSDDADAISETIVNNVNRLFDIINATKIISIDAAYASSAAAFGLRVRAVRKLIKKTRILAKQQSAT